MVGWFANDCASHAIAANGISVRMRCRHRVNPDGGRWMKQWKGRRSRHRRAQRMTVVLSA
jgi:hypothetical protein